MRIVEVVECCHALPQVPHGRVLRRQRLNPGLDACRLGRVFDLPGVPTPYMSKGSYFGLAGKPAFQRLIYPLPERASLGMHYTSDLSGRGRFGPDALARAYQV